MARIEEQQKALHCKRFGELAVEEGLLRPTDLASCLRIQERQRHAFQNANPRKTPFKIDRIGEIVVQQGFAKREDVSRVLAIQKMFDTLSDHARGISTGDSPVHEPDAGAGRLSSNPTPTFEQDSPSNTRRLGDYLLLKKIGQGAMGNVYLARQESMDRQVALKILSPEMALDEEYVERFRREARAAAKIDHPNVVNAYEVGVIAAYHFIAMEYVDGGDLETLLDQKPDQRFRSREVVEIARDMAYALQAAEKQGIVHRDIKPANILFHSEGLYKLTDLGLAAKRAEDIRVTKTGRAIGTPFYISPEQAQGELDVDIRSDIYSLGATLYHLASGKLPFEGANSVVVMTQHIAEPLKPPRDVQPRIPKSLSRLIEKMMAKRPEDRHQSPAELLADIQLLEAGGMPLLKRARARLQPSEGERGENVTAAEVAVVQVARRKSMPPSKRSNHPRMSRHPVNKLVRARNKPSMSLTVILLLTGCVLGAAIAALAFLGFAKNKGVFEKRQEPAPPADVYRDKPGADKK